jgi:hypothetical protein
MNKTMTFEERATYMGAIAEHIRGLAMKSPVNKSDLGDAAIFLAAEAEQMHAVSKKFAARRAKAKA